jgi:hypothetical protein
LQQTVREAPHTAAEVCRHDAGEVQPQEIDRILELVAPSADVLALGSDGPFSYLVLLTM